MCLIISSDCLDFPHQVSDHGSRGTFAENDAVVDNACILLGIVWFLVVQCVALTRVPPSSCSGLVAVRLHFSIFVRVCVLAGMSFTCKFDIVSERRGPGSANSKVGVAHSHVFVLFFDGFGNVPASVSRSIPCLVNRGGGGMGSATASACLPGLASLALFSSNPHFTFISCS